MSTTKKTWRYKKETNLDVSPDGFSAFGALFKAWMVLCDLTYELFMLAWTVIILGVLWMVIF